MKSLLLAFIFTATSSFAAKPEKCDEAYKKIYRDDELNISIFMGYSDDSSDEVTDPYDRANLSELLIMNCSELENFQLCGFKRDPDDADVFTKSLVRADGKVDKVKIRVMDSAFSTSHSRNMTEHKTSQLLKTKKVNEAFQKALAEDEVVFYNGHARRGTGPGFQPMTNTDWIGAVVSKAPLKSMTKTLKESKTKPALIGMITCEGEHHYGKALHEASPGTALLLTRQTTSFFDSAAIMNSAIASILKKDCATEFRKSIKDSVQNFYTSQEDGDKTLNDKLPEVYGLFEPTKKTFPTPRGALMTIVNDQSETHSTRQQEEEKSKKAKPPAETDVTR